MPPFLFIIFQKRLNLKIQFCLYIQKTLNARNKIKLEINRRRYRFSGLKVK